MASKTGSGTSVDRDPELEARCAAKHKPKEPEVCIEKPPPRCDEPVDDVKSCKPKPNTEYVQKCRASIRKPEKETCDGKKCVEEDVSSLSFCKEKKDTCEAKEEGKDKGKK